MRLEFISIFAPLYEEGHTIDDMLFVSYNQCMELMGLSTHFHQYNKRKAKYPAHILRIDGKPYISEHYLNRLLQYHCATGLLQNLKKVGGNNE